MTDQEIDDLSQYFRFIRYRNQGEMLLEEYDALQDIVKKYSAAREMEDAYFLFLQGKISEEEYQERLDVYRQQLQNEVAKKQAKKIVTSSKIYVDCDGVLLDTESGLFDDYYLLKEKNPDLHKREYLQNLDWRYWIYHAPILGDSINILRSYDPKKTDILTVVHSLKEAEAKIDFFRGKKVQNNIIFVPAGISKSQVVSALNCPLVDNSDSNLQNWDYNFGIPFSYGNPKSSFEMIDSLDEVLNDQKIEKRLIKMFTKKQM